MTIEIAKIRAAAEAATPGPWDVVGKDRYVDIRFGGASANEVIVKWVGFEACDLSTRRTRANAKFIAAANPATVIAMCDEIERLRADTARLDWLENNLFNRENIDWITKKPSTTHAMWVMFAPIGVQGSARSIIDAAIEQVVRQKAGLK